MNIRKRHLRQLISRSIVLVFAFTWMMPPIASAAPKEKGKEISFHTVRDLDTNKFGISDPAGLTFSTEEEALQIISPDFSDQAVSSIIDLLSMTIEGNMKGATKIEAANLDPFNTVFHEKIGGLLMLDRSGQNLVVVPAGADGALQPSVLSSLDVKAWGVRKALGMTVNQDEGQIFILDQSGPRIIKIAPAGGTDIGNTAVTEVNLSKLGMTNPKGLAYDPATGNISIFDQKRQALYQITEAGGLEAVCDLTGLNFSSMEGMVFAPSFDQTDDPQQTSLYLVDSRISKAKPSAEADKAGEDDLYRTSAAVAEADGSQGRLIEVSLYEAVTLAAETYRSELKNTIYTSEFSPASPDPSGVEYMPSSNSLLICDSEVEEMGIWDGANLFETALDGSLLGTSSTISFSIEPTGIACNNSNGHLFFSDDDRRRVTEVMPGTGSVVTYFKTSYFGSGDPEGIAFDSSTNTLFIIDGVNEEVYKVTPGNNGRFEGVAPYGDDQVTHFDTSSLGIHDPEGIAFYPATGNLYIAGEPRTVSVEVTTAGALVQMIDISAASARVPAGLGIGPSSSDPSTLVMYLTDRGLDNDSYPTENDGKVYELSIPVPPGAAPTVNISSPEGGTSYTAGETITFSGNASDWNDGDLSSEIVWTLPGGETVTGSTFSRSDLPAGTHIIRAAATNSLGGTGSASVTITVVENSTPAVTISSPAEGDRYRPGESITFIGSASDAEDGDLSEGITWTMPGGATVTGSTFTKTDLPLGTHTITASAADTLGKAGSASVTITVAENTAPTVSISSPSDGAAYLDGETVSFSATASDLDDGDLSGGITWTLPGGETVTGSTFTKSDLPSGTNTISAAVSDSEGATGSASVTITIDANTAPAVEISSPTGGTAFTVGDSVSFSGTASDEEDGNLSANLTWTSSLDGVIGNGSSFTYSGLSAGTHVITAEVKDLNGDSGFASVTITVESLQEPGINNFFATDDATISSINKTVNYGSDTTLRLRYSTEKLRSYLKFDVTGLVGTVQSAKLRIYLTSSTDNSGTAYLVSNNYYGSTAPWTEGGLTWDNAPKTSGVAMTGIKKVPINTWVEIDVTAVINGNGQYSFALVSTSSKLGVYNSSEAAVNQPELVIVTE